MFSFVTDQAENLYNFVKGEYDYDGMQKYIDEYNSKPDSEKKKLAKQAIIVK